METRLLARLLGAARTVTPLAAISPARAAGDAHDSELVRAQVGERLADGTYRVLVGAKALKLQLPSGVKTGDIVALSIRNGQYAGVARVVAPHAQPGALSRAGQLIAALLAQPEADPPPQADPVLDAPPLRPQELPGPLARALERSGVFYESHQARWVEADYPLERLLQEPQAKLAEPALAGAPPRAAETGRPPLPAAAAPRSDASLPEPDIETGMQPAAARYGQDDPALGRESLPLLREMLPLVRNQLETLESGRITWIGEIWPGQPMRWEIQADVAATRADEEPLPQDDDGAAARQDGDENGAWTTRFSLALPALGEVDADLAIAPAGVRVTLHAHTRQSESLMRECMPELAQALSAAGIAPTSLEVKCDEPAG